MPTSTTVSENKKKSSPQKLPPAANHKQPRRTKKQKQKNIALPFPSLHPYCIVPSPSLPPVLTIFMFLYLVRSGSAASPAPASVAGGSMDAGTRNGEESKPLWATPPPPPPREQGLCETLLRRIWRRRSRLALLDLCLRSRSSLRPLSCCSCLSFSWSRSICVRVRAAAPASEQRTASSAWRKHAGGVQNNATSHPTGRQKQPLSVRKWHAGRYKFMYIDTLSVRTRTLRGATHQAK